MRQRFRVAPSGHPVIRSSPPHVFLEGVVADAAGNLYLTAGSQNQVFQVTPEGVVVAVGGPVDLSVPSALALDKEGNLYISDTGRHRVLKLESDGRLLTVAGTGTAGFSGEGGPATAAQLNGPWGLAVDLHGTLSIADAANHRVRQVTPEGIISTIAGTGAPGFSGDGGPAQRARLDRPLDLAVDSQGTLFLVDSLNGRVRRVDREGVITTVFASAGESGAASARYYPARVAIDAAGHLLVADPFCHRVITVPGVAAPALRARGAFRSP